ncbi:TetR/AcrR family transcriptional regulator [Streptomyces catenulae]|uniref:TetR family transcriptional regulator n=1 Tax=Streptomyces catenulae TaxID=66875 RepID=A0ABV2YTP9_9ACTN|nr:TetR/AcrR family transcriptional regulator [Streptomyces catenulae]
MTTARAAGTAPPAVPRPAAPADGLRERKKRRTRQAIRDAAFRLFDSRGYDATSVDRIAEAADVSPSTVARYFPAKEDIVLRDVHGELLVAELAARPDGEPLPEALRAAALAVSARLSARDLRELRRRARLIRDVPAVRRRTADHHARAAADLTAALTARTGRPADDLEIRVIGAALPAALQEALLHWAEGPSGGRGTELAAAIGQALDVLLRGLTLSSSPE